MATTEPHTSRIRAVAARQAWVVAHRQLLELGATRSWIRNRVKNGRLHPRWPGVYAVGRAELSREGEWMGAVLTCGPGAVLSHASAAVLWGFGAGELAEIEVSIPTPRQVERDGIVVHRSNRLAPHDVTRRRNIPATNPVRTLLDLAARFDTDPLEAAVNAAVASRLTSPEGLRTALEAHPREPGVQVLRDLLDARTFRLTDSRLERLFIPIALEAGLPRPLTQQRVNGYRVDFYWPERGLVVETDGAAFHHTAAQQTRDRRRDQAHTAAGLIALRFTHGQIAYDRAHVRRTLEPVAQRS